MHDNRLPMMRVNRSVATSRAAHGDETVQTRSEGTGSTAPPRDANAGAWSDASGGSARVRGQSADRLCLGMHAGGGSVRLAAPAAGPSWRDDRGRAGEAEQAVGRGCAGQWLSH